MKQAILSRLPEDFPWRDRIHWFDTIDSTNTRAKTLAAQGAPQGTVVLAGSQTHGRGRMGRSFHSPSGSGIYLSVILRPDRTPQELMHLTCAAGCAMCGAVEATCGVRPGIKWINDLVLIQRKVGGILAEMALNATGSVDYAVIGIGINCHQAAEDFPAPLRQIAASLSMVCETGVDRAALAAAMIARLEVMSRQLFSEKTAIMKQYRADCVTLGRQVQLHGAKTGTGTALDVDENGGLIVRLDDGTVHTVQSGEVSVRGMFGYV